MSCPLEIISTTNNRVNFSWKLNDCFQQNNATYNSTVFTLNTIDKTTVSFVLSAKTSDSKLHICVKQIAERAGRGILMLAVDNGEVTKVITTSFVEKWDENSKFYPVGFVSEDKETFVITGNITWMGFSDADQNQSTIGEAPPANAANDDKFTADFTIAVEDQEIPTSRALLARHSSVLLAKESPESRIVVDDVTSSIMKILIGIINTGVINKRLDDVNTALEVLEAAEKYQILMVKSICEDKLQLNIKDCNVLTVLEAADAYNARELCQTCVDYIIVTKEKVISAEDFEKLCEDRPNLQAAVTNSEIRKLQLLPSVECN